MIAALGQSLPKLCFGHRLVVSAFTSASALKSKLCARLCEPCCPAPDSPSVPSEPGPPPVGPAAVAVLPCTVQPGVSQRNACQWFTQTTLPLNRKCTSGPSKQPMPGADSEGSPSVSRREDDVPAENDVAHRSVPTLKRRPGCPSVVVVAVAGAHEIVLDDVVIARLPSRVARMPSAEKLATTFPCGHTIRARGLMPKSEC